MKDLLQNNSVLKLSDVSEFPTDNKLKKYSKMSEDRSKISKKEFVRNRFLNEVFNPLMQVFSDTQEVVLVIKSLALFVDDFNS